MDNWDAEFYQSTNPDDPLYYDFTLTKTSRLNDLARYELGTTSTWPSTIANTYELTTFDKLVGWSRWMYLNSTPPPAWSPSSFNFVLPEDKVTELPN